MVMLMFFININANGSSSITDYEKKTMMLINDNLNSYQDHNFDEVYKIKLIHKNRYEYPMSVLLLHVTAYAY